MKNLELINLLSLGNVVVQPCENAEVKLKNLFLMLNLMFWTKFKMKTLKIH